MMSFFEITRRPTFHLLVFCVGFLLFGWPLLSIATRHQDVTGLHYLFTVWGALIVGLALFSRYLSRSEDKNHTQDNGHI